MALPGPTSLVRLGLLVIAAALTVAHPGHVEAALAYPKPSPVPYQWELDFQAGDLRIYTDAATGQHYWYFTYKVTNRTNRDRFWAPSFTLFNDAGEILGGGRRVPVRVTQNIMTMLDNELLEDQNQIIGNVLQGEKNAREGLVVWPARELDITEMSLFITGISGETSTVENPLTGEMETVNKTLERQYYLPGEVLPRASEAMNCTGQRWILR